MFMYCCSKHRGGCIFSNYGFLWMCVQEWDCWILWLSDSDEGVASLLSGRYFYICLANITLWFCLCPCHGNWFGLELSLPALQFISITAHHCLSYLFNARPGGSSGKEPTCQFRRHESQGFDPQVRKMPWQRAWQPTAVFLPGESPWRETPGG